VTRLITVYPREIKRSGVASVKCCIGERNLARLLVCRNKFVWRFTRAVFGDTRGRQAQ